MRSYERRRWARGESAPRSRSSFLAVLCEPYSQSEATVEGVPLLTVGTTMGLSESDRPAPWNLAAVSCKAVLALRCELCAVD